VAVFTQFKHARRDPGDMENATVILYAEKHHWAWVIPLSDDVDSVGVVVPSATYKQHGRTPEELLDWAVDHLHPELTRRIGGCERVEAVRFVGNYSYRIDPYVGDGWVCVGDAHRFADPIFSFGVSFAMAEALEAGRAIVSGLESGDLDERLAGYVEVSDRGQDAAFDLLRYFWRYPAFFSFLMRGPHRHDVIRLFAGDSFDEVEFPVLRSMRESLALGPVGSIPEGDAREIARRITRIYADFQGVEAAYLQLSTDGLLLHFVVIDEDPGVADSIHDFEESLYGDFGRERLAVLQWCMAHRSPVPGFTEAHRVYDRRPL
jgi:FADH2-dependent halogenase